MEVDPEAGAITSEARVPKYTERDVDAELERRAFDALMDRERAKLKPMADRLKQDIRAGKGPDIADDREWK